MKILHFCPDDKFMAFVQECFETVFPGASRFRVRGRRGTGPEYLRAGPDVERVGSSYWRSHRVRAEMADADCLVINFMHPRFAEAVKLAPPRLLVIWVGWGADYASLLQPYTGALCLPQTTELVRRLPGRLLARTGQESSRISFAIDAGLRRLKTVCRGPRASLADVIGRIDYAWVHAEEQAYLERALPGFSRRYHRMFCFSAERTFAVGPERMDGEDILIGNSATPTNNHLELFDELGRLDLGDRRLIAPLSYGNSRYGDMIARIGVKRFGRRFVPLRSYMPPEEYYGYLRRCGTVIMNHVRQQAGTTVATALYKGAKVYLRDENPLLSFYRKMGIRVSSVPDDLHRAGDTFGPVTEAEMARTRETLNAHWGHQAALDSVRGLASLVADKRAA